MQKTIQIVKYVCAVFLQAFSSRNVNRVANCSPPALEHTHKSYTPLYFVQAIADMFRVCAMLFIHMLCRMCAQSRLLCAKWSIQIHCEIAHKMSLASHS